MGHIRNIADVCQDISEIAKEAVSLAERKKSVLVKLGQIEELLDEAVEMEMTEIFISTRKVSE